MLRNGWSPNIKTLEDITGDTCARSIQRNVRLYLHLHQKSDFDARLVRAMGHYLRLAQHGNDSVAAETAPSIWHTVPIEPHVLPIPEHLY